MILVSYLLIFMAGTLFGAVIMAIMNAGDDPEEDKRGYDAVLPSDLAERRDAVRWFLERTRRER